MKNLIKIDEEKVIKRSSTGAVSLSCIKIHLTILIIFTLSMMIGIATSAAEPSKRNVSEITMRFLDNSNGIYEWTGEQIKPSVGFVDANGSSMGKDSLKIIYGANVEPGKGTITVTGLGDEGTDWQYRWYGTKTFEFEIVKAENHIATWAINGSYHDGFVFSKNVKNDIKEIGGLPDESIKAIDKADLKFTVSDSKIFKLNKSKNSITVTGVGIAYLNFTIPETDHYKSCNGRIEIISYPPKTGYNSYWPVLKSGNGFKYGVTNGKSVGKSKTDFKCKVIIATNKNFKKSSIIKSYTLTKKEFNKQKMKTIKSKKFKKGKKFYVKTYTYKKLSDGKTMYGETDIIGFKISKKGRISSMDKRYNIEDPCIK